MDFFEQFRRLVFSRPHNAVSSRAVENCSFGDYLYRSRNIYLSYFLTDCEDCFYGEYLKRCRDCIDCSYLTASELCCECVDCTNLYGCSFMQDCHTCSDCTACFDCINCKNCFGCFGLRQQQFCIFNKPYSEETYREKIALLKKTPPLKTLEILQPEFDKHPRLYARLLKGGENCFGDYIFFSKNCFYCFNVRNVEDSAYVSEAMDPEFETKNSFDCNFANGIELCYDCDAVSMSYNCNFMAQCSSCTDCGYCVYCYNCRNCFGCVYLQNKEYCILNRQLTREEYLVAMKNIKAELKASGAYGKPLAEVLKGW